MAPRYRSLALALIAAFLTSAAPAWAQGARPRAWFGGGMGAVGQSLSGSLSLGYGTFMREADVPGNDAPSVRTESSFGSLSGGLQYSLNAGRATFSAGFSSGGSYYPDVTKDIFISHSASVSGSFQFSSKTSMSASHSVSYSPPFAQSLQAIFSPGPAPLEPPDIASEAVEARAVTQSTNVSLQQVLTSRSNLSLGYSHFRFRFSSSGPIQTGDDANIRYTHALTKGLGFRVGYVYGRSRVSDDPDSPAQERSGIDAGLDFSHALSLTRTTTFSFGLGTAVARSGGSTTVLLLGNVALDQKIGRSWSAGATYSRDANFVPGITGLVVSDRAGARLGGQLSRRVSLTSSVDYSRGGVGQGENKNPFTALTASAGSSISLTRSVGLGLRYAYYESDFATTDFLLSPGLSKTSGQSTSASIGWRFLQFSVSYSIYHYLSTRSESMSASLSLSAPLFARARRPDATR